VSPPFFLLYTMRPPPRSPLFPYTTLFRSSLADAFAAAAEPREGWRAARDGVVVGITNPKSYILFGAVLPQFVNRAAGDVPGQMRSEEHTSELQSLTNIVCRLLLEKKNTNPDDPNGARQQRPRAKLPTRPSPPLAVT